jgi:hypothetical protein
MERSVDLRNRKLMVAIPCYDGKVNVHAAFQLAALMPAIARYGVSVQLAHIAGCSIITKARNALAHMFMQSDCTDLLFVDADINFKVEDVLRIVALSGDKDVVAGAYPRRADDKKFFTDIHYPLELADGLLRVERVGTGFMLIRRHVLEKLEADHPEWKFWVNTEQAHHTAFFDFKQTAEGYIGEDYLFCDRARAAGFKIYIDPEINLGHFGSTEFTGHFGDQVVKPLLEMQHAEITRVAA